MWNPFSTPKLSVYVSMNTDGYRSVHITGGTPEQVAELIGAAFQHAPDAVVRDINRIGDQAEVAPR